jgi:hypothetical protein
MDTRQQILKTNSSLNPHEKIPEVMSLSFSSLTYEMRKVKSKRGRRKMLFNKSGLLSTLPFTFSLLPLNFRAG